MVRQYDSHGRDQINIENFWGNWFGQNQEGSGRSKNEKILLMAVKDEVETRLESSLRHAVFLNLGKEARPNQVKRTWDSEIKIGTKAAEIIPDDTTIVQVFESAPIKGKLLILGQPGSGKTTTLLDLAKTLVEKAEADSIYPIPVLFNLSSWRDEKQLIRDWMVTELRSKYSFSTKLGKQWVAERVLLPLLDGLDEVAPERQERCVQQINTFLTGESSPLYAVVCSRIAGYENYKTPLQLNGAVYLKELSDRQIQDYLMKIGRQELWQSITQNSELLAFVRTPLVIGTLVLTYPQNEMERGQQLQVAKNSIQYLLDKYVERMFHRQIENRFYGKLKPPTPRQARYWLIWLAGQMKQTEFLIEQMQPSWLETQRKWLYRLLCSLISGLMGGLSFWVVGGLNFWLSPWLRGWLDTWLTTKGYNLISNPFLCVQIALNLKIIGFHTLSIEQSDFFLLGGLLGLVIGLVISFRQIKLVEVIQISRLTSLDSALMRLLQIGLSRYLSAVLGIFMSLGILLGWSKFMSLFVSMLPFLIIGLISTIIVTLINGLKADIKIRTRPNQGIWNSRDNTLLISTVTLVFVFLLYFTVALLLACITGIFLFENSGEIITSLLAFFFYIVFVISGGGACIQHFALRVVLYRARIIPWNYARFLGYATERGILQCIGGRYRFMHESLQNHFSKMSENLFEQLL